MSTCLYKFEDIPTHGDKISSKQEGMTRFYFENVDGLPVDSRDKFFKKDKLRKLYHNGRQIFYYVVRLEDKK